MPFTISHIAAVLPISKAKQLSATGLIIGSIVPDLEFVLQLKVVDHSSHTLPGIFLFDLPLALVLCLVFHLVIRDSLIISLPSYLQSKFIKFTRLNWINYFKINYLKVILSLLVGIGSHLVLDGFTHHDGIFIEIMPYLEYPIKLLHLPVYQALQVILSILGLGYISWYILKMEKCNISPNSSHLSGAYWSSFTGIAFVLLAARLALWQEHNDFWSVCMAVLGITFYALIATSLISKLYTFKSSTI